MQHPVDFFNYFVTEELLKLISEETIRYHFQLRPQKLWSVTLTDIQGFIGAGMLMSIIRLPQSRMYWRPEFLVAEIANAFTVKKFEDIKRFLHFADNTVQSQDKLKKFRPVSDYLCERFKTIPKEEHLSIDEQIIPFKGRSSLKQYNAAKPHKWGYKAFVLCGASGFAYDLEYYVGRDNNLLMPNEVDCGASGNVVVRLSRNVPNNLNYKLYFDNYFTSPDLQVFLAKRGIWSLGTVRINRVPNSNLISDEKLKKQGRGCFSEQIAEIEDIPITVLKWCDNKCVTFLSTFVGGQPTELSQRWDGKESRYKSVTCPNLVKVYNKHMGGVDLIDSLIGLYRNRVRSKKWYHRLWFHIMDLTLVNSWLLYKRTFTEQNKDGTSSALPMPLLDFKNEVARSLLRKGKLNFTMELFMIAVLVA